MYINDLLNELELVGTANISNIHTSNPSFADDVVCIGTSPQRLQNMLNCAYDYSLKWRFEFNPLKSVILGYRTELDLVFNLGDKSVNISTETKHLGILRTVDLSPSTDIQHSCRKGRNAYFAIPGTGSCLLNPLTVCGLYNKIVIPAVLYGCELWNGIKPKDIRCLETFQHFIVKHIQGFPKRTRSDMCESMTNLERLPILVEKRKLMFLYKLCEMKAQSLTKQIFIYRLFQYFGDTSRKQHGFIPDVTNILSKYSLLNFLNSYMFTGCFPTKLQWKNIVNGAINQHEKHRKEERMRSDNDFTRFLRLSENNGYDFIWQYAKYTGRLRTAKHVAKLWSTPPTNGNCNLCGHFVQDTLYHQIKMCTELQTQRHLLYKRLSEMTSDNFLYTLLSKSDEYVSCFLLGNHEALLDLLTPEHCLDVFNEGFSYLKYCRL